MNTHTFAELGLIDPIQKALRTIQFETPTPIQNQSIPQLLDGQDLLGIAQTGTGKTAAFALPMLQHLTQKKPSMKGRRPIRGLILAPTRELAAQISMELERFSPHLPLRHTVIFGGVGQDPQVRRLKKGVDILVATPGRLLDLMGQGYIDLKKIEVFVLDEADRMLDMGFAPDVKKVLAQLPSVKPQSLLFSATMPAEIEELARGFLHEPHRVEITPREVAVDRIEQSVFYVNRQEKRDVLFDMLEDPSLERVIVFTRTKHRANRVAEYLEKKGVVSRAIHGNKSQGARTQALQMFRAGKARVLVATDIAARGIDVPGVSHVINFELPNEPESYVHRIGRTARAGEDGIAFSFCDPEEYAYLKDIEKLTRVPLKVSMGVPPQVEKPQRSSQRGSRRAPRRRTQDKRA